MSGEKLTSLLFPEQLSHQLALRFAKKCFSPLEIVHFKDVFRSLADEQDAVWYWKEETLCRFLALPDSLGVGALVYQMASYLGSFPFPSLAPSILTMEALLKVVVIMTERYDKILKRGKADRHKLLFRSLAVFDRAVSSRYEQTRTEDLPAAHDEKLGGAHAAASAENATAAEFSIDRPGSDDGEDEDDDELALAALESLDAIEVFKHDQRTDTNIHHARIPLDSFQSIKLDELRSPMARKVDRTFRAHDADARDCAAQSPRASRTTRRTADRVQPHRFTTSG